MAEVGGVIVISFTVFVLITAIMAAGLLFWQGHTVQESTVPHYSALSGLGAVVSFSLFMIAAIWFLAAAIRFVARTR